MTEDPVPDPRAPGRSTVALQTVGCKLNQAESEAIARRFAGAGFELVTTQDSPDVYILNTCTVTHIADRKCRQYLRSAHRKNPEALIVAAGCYVDRDVDEVTVEGVDLTVGNADKFKLVEMVEGHLAAKKAAVWNDAHHSSTGPFRTRSMVEVQAGCSHCCSYCIVPQVRGRERSIPARIILSEIKAREEEGYQEIVLTGTRIGRYGDEDGLEGLLKLILGRTEIPRIRLSSLQPRELSPSLIDLWQGDERICRHIHLALQSGCAATLERMGRDYSLDEYESAVNMVREAMPDIAITTDIIGGFPGETQEEFEESFRFCSSLGFAGMHVFPYSARAGTPAAEMPGRVPDEIKKARSQRMLDLAQETSAKFRERFSGEIMPVLWEEQKEGNIWTGHTGNYIKVFTTSDESLHNRLIETELGGQYRQGIWGDIGRSLKMAGLAAKGV
ncbi:MAG: tRNA (N(6)-L-threonylcarbamoyladenosine(37)-C(2))-methylthiotransferase MtaB [Dehalococcoidia bacterium]